MRRESALICASIAEAQQLEGLERRGRKPRSKLDVRLWNDV
jgi:hypothetical protein